MNGFAKYERFYTAPPAIVVEWHDDQTPARGWLAIDSLQGGAAGGGTRMRTGGSKQEAVFLAKTMAVKFRVAGPDIGGGKSVLDFNAGADPKVKEGVLRRWYRHVGPYLRSCYGTGGDVGVDEVSEATRYIKEEVGNLHPQEGIARGHDAYKTDGEGPGPKIERLKHGVEARVVLKDLPGIRDGAWMIADVSTGWGVVESIRTHFRLRGEKLEGKRAIVEGFGAVGAFAAYYLEKLGVRVVAASSHNAAGTIRCAASDTGLDVRGLIGARDGTRLPAPGATRAFISDTDGADGIFRFPADIFVPAAASHTIDLSRVRTLRELGVKVVACGANNPFAADHRKPTLADWVRDMLEVQREADRHFAILPDFIANCGMARTFAYLMNKGGKTDEASILRDTTDRIEGAMSRLCEGHAAATGLLERGYELFVPER
jgi:glutamate dehydrogenase (NAD(P)+)